VSRRIVPVGDVELCVETFGDAAQPPVLLVTGAAAAMDWWDSDLCRRMADGGRYVVRYDHRDTGESTTGEPGSPTYDTRQLERDCAGLIEALGARPVHLVGLSMGGGIVQAVALRRPHRVRTLTLLCTSPVGGVDADLPGPSATLAATFETPPPEPDWADLDSYADWVVATHRPYAGSVGLDESRVRSIAAATHARSHDVSAAGNHWLVLSGDADREDDAGATLDVRGITAPTLVIHGTDDPLFPLPHGQALAAAIPGATLLVVRGMGHESPPPSTWDQIVPALLDHTTSTRAAATGQRR
jgi:pimeloyl-ACP methyl ester carboxylesterase